ncbi:MAG: hypothetical protein J6U10_02225 [Lachnospiraceae bacterium]|nr:hypothetical protein [Lachnospiraceae bacterium]
MFLSFLTGCGKNKEIADVKSFRFSYSNGSMMNSSTVYELTSKDGEYIARYKPYLIPEKLTLEIKTDKAFADTLAEIMKKNNVGKWDGYSKSDKNVLDGDSFGFSARYGDKGSISAHGYMKYPANYGKFSGEVDEAFCGLFEALEEYKRLGDPNDYINVDVEALKAAYPQAFEYSFDNMPVLVYDSFHTFTFKTSAEIEANPIYVPKYDLTATEAKAVIKTLYGIPFGIGVVFNQNPASSYMFGKEEADRVLLAVKYYMYQR